MKKAVIIIASVILAAVSSQPLMSVLQRIVLPRGQQFSVISPSEPIVTFVLFTLGFCACVGVVLSAVYFLRHSSLVVRCATVVLPMIAGGCLATVVKAVQIEGAVAAAGSVGLAPAFSLKQASLHTIPLVSLAAGLLGFMFTFILRKPKDREQAVDNR